MELDYDKIMMAGKTLTNHLEELKNLKEEQKTMVQDATKLIADHLQKAIQLWQSVLAAHDLDDISYDTERQEITKEDQEKFNEMVQHYELIDNVSEISGVKFMVKFDDYDDYCESVSNILDTVFRWGDNKSIENLYSVSATLEAKSQAWYSSKC
jgi:hypothetical protein